MQEFCCYETFREQQATLSFVMIGFQKMAIYFKIVSVVCKAVPTECTEDKMHIFLQAFSCWPKYRKGLRKDRFNLHDAN